MISLDVWLDLELVGRLTHDSGTNQFGLAYVDEWCNSRAAYPLGPQLPVQRPAQQTNEQHSPIVRQFFENLLPEGEALDHAAQAAGTGKSNLVGLLISLGRETSGAIRVTSPDARDDHEVERISEITREALSERIRARKEVPFSVWDGRVRLSIAGFQDKIAVFENQGKWFLVDGPRLASTEIVKPLPVKDALATLPENEHTCMQLAGRVGLIAASTRLEKVPEPVLFVRRFDREREGDRIKRLHVIDGCQALGLPVTSKYERNYGDAPAVRNIRDGASFPKLFRLIRDYSPSPAVDVRKLLRWAIFQVLVGNHDAHGKNLSFYCGPQGIQMAPAYDIVCIPAVPAELSREFAMAVGDAFSSEALTPYEWAHFAYLCDLPFRLVAREIEVLCQRILDVSGDVKAKAHEDLVAPDVYNSILDFVTRECTRQLAFAARVREFKVRDFS